MVPGWMAGGADSLRLPQLYLALAHLSLALACAVIALDPWSVAGFHYHPRMLMVVHLVTLGWVTSALLACLLLLRRDCSRAKSPGGAESSGRESAGARGRLGDGLSFLFYGLAFSGMIAHFWIGETSGVGWSGFVVAWVVLGQGARAIAAAAGRPGLSRGLLLGLTLSLINLIVAAILGMAIVVDRYFEVLPGHVLSHVHAHAHLATLGWTGLSMLTLGAFAGLGRMDRWRLWALEAAVLVLVLGFLTGGALHGVAAVLAGVTWLCASGSLRGSGPWPGMSLWLGLSVVLGLLLVFWPTAASHRLVLAYGTCGLLGYLGEGLLDLQHRLFASSEAGPWLSWTWRLGVALLASALALDWIPGIAFGALALLAAVGLSARALFWTGAC